VVALAALVFSGIRPMLFPSQEVEYARGFGLGAIPSNVILRQEIPLKKDFIRGVDVVMANFNRIEGIENVILVTDAAGNVLFTKKVDSKEITSPAFMHFDFTRNLKIGKGNSCFVCLYSTNANPQQYVSLVINTHSRLGKFEVASVVNNDVMASLRGPWNKIEGSIVLKTFETNTEFFSGFQVLLYLLVLLLGLLIFFFPEIRIFILRFNLRPEWVYLALGLISGLILVFLTPPLQSPDENKHFFRAYQVSELNLFQSDPTVPKALSDIAENYSRLNFANIAKPEKGETEAMAKIRVNPADRVQVDLPKEFLPFLPQAAGMTIGKLFSASPLSLIYWGRIFNLLVSLMIIFLAIRITPVFKWVFFLVALMPMTIFLFSSLSHDVLTISLALLFSAVCFRFAYSPGVILKRNNMILLFALTLLLALCKQPYYLLVFFFFLIPVKRIGSLKKYLLVFGGMLVIVILATQVAGIGKSLAPAAAPRMITTPVAQADSVHTPVMDQTKQKDHVNPAKQQKFILSDPIRYIGIMISTLTHNFRSFYLDTMVGRLGWLSVSMPSWLVTLYLLILLFAALFDADSRIMPDWKQRLLITGTGIVIIALIETAMYLLWTPIGQPEILGIQGRYLIPVLPFILFLLYNNFLANRVNLYLSPGREKMKTLKAAAKTKLQEEILFEERLFSRMTGYLASLFVMLSLACTLYVILDKYYIVLF